MDTAENIRADDELLESEDGLYLSDTGVANAKVSNIPDAALHRVRVTQDLEQEVAFYA